MLVAAWAAAAVEPELGWLWADCVFGWMLLALAWIDWTHLRLPDVLTLPLLLAGLGATALLDPDDATDHALAAAIGYAALRLVSFGYLKLRGREGLGAGDAKLLAAAGGVAWAGRAGSGAAAGLPWRPGGGAWPRRAARHDGHSAWHLPCRCGLAGPAVRPVRARSSPGGFALLIVLWSVVLLALLATGITAAGRSQTQLAGNVRRAAAAEAAADGGIYAAAFHTTDAPARGLAG